PLPIPERSSSSGWSQPARPRDRTGPLAPMPEHTSQLRSRLLSGTQPPLAIGPSRSSLREAGPGQDQAPVVFVSGRAGADAPGPADEAPVAESLLDPSVGPRRPGAFPGASGSASSDTGAALPDLTAGLPDFTVPAVPGSSGPALDRIKDRGVRPARQRSDRR